jgi:DNA-binding CsgD family transcriptional regulator
VSLRDALWILIGGAFGWAWARRVLANASPSAPVTRRQAEILAFVARGMSTKEIARRAGISEHSVNTHVRRACAALGVPSRAAAVAVLRGEDQTPERPRRSATRVRATITSPTSSSNGI